MQSLRKLVSNCYTDAAVKEDKDCHRQLSYQPQLTHCDVIASFNSSPARNSIFFSLLKPKY